MIKAHKAIHYDVREFVPESVYLDRGEKAWQLIDIRLVENYDALKENLCRLYGRDIAVTINDWLWGGSRVASGLRIPGQAHYSRYSQHPFGRAGDSVCEIPAQDIRDHIKAEEIVLPHAACFEEFDGMGWLHMDVRNMINGHTYFFKP
jgi:hypothetical protein